MGMNIGLSYRCRQIYNMNRQPVIHQIAHLLKSNPNLHQFQQRLHASPINQNPCYLGLLLMSIVSIPLPKIQYIRILIKYGADVNFTEPSSGHQLNAKSVFMIACEKSVSENVKFLLSREDLQVGAVDASGENALHYALRNPSEQQGLKIIHAILKQFPHLITANPKNFLFSAIDLQKLHIISFLLTHYLDPNQQTEPVGLTALQYTISLADLLPSQVIKQIIITLLRHNANPGKQNFLNEDSYDYADRYLFDLEELVAKYYTAGEAQKTKGTKCFTICTHEDTGTSYSKDSDCFNIWEYKKQEQSVDVDHEQLIAAEFLVAQKAQLRIEQQEKQQQQIAQNDVAYLEESDSSGQQQGQTTLEQFNCKFSQQILSHSESYISSYNQAAQDIAEIYRYLQQIGQESELKLQVIGSFATRLWTAHSDIDLVYINEKPSFVNVGKLLEKIHRQIRIRYRQLGISEIFLNLDTKFPNIKIKMNEQFNERKIEISIFQRKCSGRKYVQFINQYINYYPYIVPLFYLLHHLLETFNLHKPTKNGLKTYTIFLIILTVLQNYSQPLSISELFINIVYYYNYCYEYSYEKVGECGEQRPIFNMMDPLNLSNNTGGKETDTERLRMMFKVVGYALEARIKDMRVDGVISQVLQLHRMFQ